MSAPSAEGPAGPGPETGLAGGGTELARAYYLEVVRPLLAARRPGLRHSAGRLGTGSDVLGLDDAMSRDHDWGLRLTVVVDEDDVAPLDALLGRALPETFRGLPTRFALTTDGVVRHRVEVVGPAGLAAARLGLPAEGDWDALDWLSLTGQAVLEVTAGPVFADTHGGVAALRQRLAWYPDDVWRFVVAADWSRLAQELPLMGRAGARGDELGSRVIAGRLAAAAMHLGFLLERRWPPYPKWLGTLFATLPTAGAAAAPLRAALVASDWRQRQEALCAALELLHDLQRATGLPTAPAGPAAPTGAAGLQATEPFHDRPFRVVPDAVGALLLEAVADPGVRALPPGVGSVEQWVDNVDVLTRPGRRVAAVRAWRAAATG